MLEPDRNVWRIERANRLSVIVDADRYFGVAREAFAAAKKRIMLVGWISTRVSRWSATAWTSTGRRRSAISSIGWSSAIRSWSCICCAGTSAR